MAWRYADDNSLVPSGQLPPKLKGEGEETYWVDQSDRPVKTNNPADYPVPVDTGGMFPGTTKDGAVQPTEGSLMSEIRDLKVYVKDLVEEIRARWPK